jgi:transcriptional regulator GlxA family with amidase domain
MRTSARNVAIVLFDEVELLDFAGPVQVLTLAGRQWNFRPFKIFPVASARSLIVTRNQVRIEAPYNFHDCPPPELLLVPGGYGARRALKDTALVRWLAETAAKTEFIGAIGYGVLLLAKAGLLADRKVAVPNDVAELFLELAPSAVAIAETPLVSDKNLWTANASAAGIDLGLAIVERTLGKKHALGVSNKLGYAWNEAAQAEVVRVVAPRERE